MAYTLQRLIISCEGSPVENQFFEQKTPSSRLAVVFLGTKDSPYVPSSLAGFPASVERMEIPGADHGLDIEGDVIRSIRILSQLTERLVPFVRK